MAAVPGLLLSIFLTIVKFRSSFRCDFALLSACSTSCSDVLTSGLSTLLGAPISIYSTAYFLVLLGFSLAILAQPTSFLAVARPILLVFGVAGLLAIAVLAGYATFVVGGLCLYCLAIYGLTIVAALGISLLHTDGYRSSLRALADRRLLTSSAPLIATLGFLAAVSVQLAGYRTMAASLTFGERCLVTGRLPETPLVTAQEDAPRVQVAIFVDLACPHCREDYATWSDYASTNPGVQLAIYHYARGGDCIPAESIKLNANAEDKDSCLAARATICADKLLPGAGLAMLGPLFDHQESPSPRFSLEVVAAIARSAGIDVPADMSDPKTEDDPFIKCLDEPESLDPILEHATFAIAHNIVETPATYLLFFDEDGAPLPTMIQILGAKHYPNLSQILDEAHRRVLGNEASAEASS